MLSREYEPLPIEVFGRKLLATGDLDPVYIAFCEAEMDENQKRRWLMAYWLFYHSGVSSWLSEQGPDWGPYLRAAYNTDASPIGGRWTRGRERRHFRAEAAVRAVEGLWDRYDSVDKAVRYLEETPTFQSRIPFRDLRARVLQWPQFGPWIAFKVGDMLERCLGLPIDFAGSDIFIFDTPKEAVALWNDTDPRAKEYNIANTTLKAMAHLDQHLGRFLAPPIYLDSLPNRPVSLQEYETILCKWKGHVGGIYPVGEDTHELQKALAPWAGVSETAKRMLEVTHGLIDAL